MPLTWKAGLGASPGGAPGSCHSGTTTNAVSLAAVVLVTVTLRYSEALSREQEPKSSCSASTRIAPAGSCPSNTSVHASGPTSCVTAGGALTPSPETPSSVACPEPLAVVRSRVPWPLAVGEPLAGPISPGSMVRVPAAAEGGLDSSCVSSTGASPAATRAKYLHQHTVGGRNCFRLWPAGKPFARCCTGGAVPSPDVSLAAPPVNAALCTERALLAFLSHVALAASCTLPNACVLSTTSRCF